MLCIVSMLLKQSQSCCDVDVCVCVCAGELLHLPEPGGQSCSERGSLYLYCRAGH